MMGWSDQTPETVFPDVLAKLLRHLVRTANLKCGDRPRSALLFVDSGAHKTTIEHLWHTWGGGFHDGNSGHFVERGGDGTRRTSWSLHDDARGPHARKARRACPRGDRGSRIRTGVPRADEYARAGRAISAGSLAC